MGRVLELPSGESAAAVRGGGIGGGEWGDLLDEEDVGEAPLAELPDDAEAIVIDPDVAAAVDGIVEGVEAGEGAAHWESEWIYRERECVRELLLLLL